jgi:hypothetical protein
MIRIFILLELLVALLCGCGNIDTCDGVDTSQAPDRSTVNGNYITFYWGSCQKTYQVR